MNLINNLWDGHCFGSSRTRRITGGKITFKLGPQFLTAYDGACSPNVSFRMALISFSTLPCRKKKNMMTAHVSMLLKSRASPDMLPFTLCNKKRLAIRHMNRPLFPTLSIPSYDMGKWIGIRTYQHPLIVCIFPPRCEHYKHNRKADKYHFNFKPSWFPQMLLIAYSKAALKSSCNKEFLRSETFLIANMSDRCLPTLTLL